MKSKNKKNDLIKTSIFKADKSEKIEKSTIEDSENTSLDTHFLLNDDKMYRKFSRFILSMMKITDKFVVDAKYHLEYESDDKKHSLILDNCKKVTSISVDVLNAYEKLQKLIPNPSNSDLKNEDEDILNNYLARQKNAPIK